jgi:hypothetical protein
LNCAARFAVGRTKAEPFAKTKQGYSTPIVANAEGSKFMKKQNNDEVVMYRHPFGATVRRKGRYYQVINYNDRSTDSGVRIAHLRAAAYRDRKQSKASPTRSQPKRAGRSAQHARGFLALGREYDIQARDNFAKEALLFCVIVVGGVAWPVIESVRALAGSS